MQIQSRIIQKKAIRVAWFILFASLTILGFSLYIVWQNQQRSVANYQLIELVEKGRDQVNLLTHQLSSTLNKKTNNSVLEKEEMETSFKALGEMVARIVTKEISGLTLIEKTEKDNESRQLEKAHAQLKGIFSLIVKHDKGVKENKDLINERLISVNTIYLEALQNMETLFFVETNSSESFMFHSQLVITLLYIILAIISFYFIILPLRRVFDNMENEFLAMQNSAMESTNKVMIAEKSQKESDLLLKTKSAQVLKLQDTLQTAIEQSLQTKRDKNMVYHNAAMDIDGYLKVVNRQREILENHTSISGEESWKILSNTISQLNSLVGDYFNRSKLGESTQVVKEVYLSPLMSEILLSLPAQSKVSFEQAGDMPSVKTNAELLKRVLTPFFELISTLDFKGKVRVMVNESESKCEIRFMEIPAGFQKSLEEVEVKQLARLSFNEFKIHMAQKIIEERGGNSWFQLDAKKTGVFYINWVL
tara:strand:+ start:68510 stop:69943 length:1434 start_codon:yes stop_codon:yes gene_type:complete